MSTENSSEKLEALSQRMEEMAMRMEERIEEYLELSRAAEPLNGVGGVRGEGMASGAHAGGVMVGVPQFFNAAHLNAVNEAYAGIEDVWLRGRMAMWNAQMRIAQGANDLEAMCLFLQLQLEGMAQVALKGLYVEAGRWSRSWSANMAVAGSEGIQEKLFEQGEEANLLPYQKFAFQINPDLQEGRYATVIEVPEEGVPFDARKFNAKSRARYLHKVFVLPIGGDGPARDARLLSQVKSLRGILGCSDHVWLTQQVFATDDEPHVVAQGEWSVAVESNVTKGSDITPKILEESHVHNFRADIKDAMLPHGKNHLQERVWRVYAKSENVFWDNEAAYEMRPWADFDSVTGEYVYENSLKHVNSCNAWRRRFGRGEIFDVLGNYGGNKASARHKLDMLMRATAVDSELIWGEKERRELDKIRKVRNLLAHGNLVKRKGRSSGLTIEDVASFWEEQVQPRMPYWVQHVEG